MKLLILGGNGMAGHMLADYFRRQGKHHVFHTTRDKSDLGGLYVDANDIAGVEKLVDIVSPHCIINAMGVLNQFAERDKIGAYHVNGFLLITCGERRRMFRQGSFISVLTACSKEHAEGTPKRMLLMEPLYMQFRKVSVRCKNPGILRFALPLLVPKSAQAVLV